MTIRQNNEIINSNEKLVIEPRREDKCFSIIDAEGRNGCRRQKQLGF